MANKSITTKYQKLAEKSKYAYVIKDKTFGEFPVLKSANAWYLDKGKLERLITAFKYDSTIKDACILAGISQDQYRYFIEQHPEFSHIIDTLRQLPIIVARKTVIDALSTDVGTARWYLERKKSDEFRKKDTPADRGEAHAQQIRDWVAETRIKYA